MQEESPRTWLNSSRHWKLARAHRTVPSKSSFFAAPPNSISGELLPGYYSDWVLLEQRRLAELFFGALTQVVAHLRSEGDVQRAIPFAEHGVRVDPLREEAHLQLIRLYVATHQWTRLGRRYRDFELILRERLTKPHLRLPSRWPRD
jgi:DNA-binding SARP family transcriptional activator